MYPKLLFVHFLHKVFRLIGLIGQWRDNLLTIWTMRVVMLTVSLFTPAGSTL